MRRALNAIIIFSAVAGFALELSAQSTSLKEAMELFRQRQWADAAKAFAECEKSDPGRTDALLYRGKSLLNLGQFDGEDAAHYLEVAVSMDPANVEARYHLATSRQTRADCGTRPSPREPIVSGS